MKRELVFHPKVPNEVRDYLEHYASISQELEEAFWTELNLSLESAALNPQHHHFDSNGLRRANLTRFPYHILFRVFPDYIRITVIRHNRRHPSFGTKRK